MNRKAKGSGFKMKGNPIKSIVAQTRTQADPSLVEAGKRLGESTVPQAIDYSLRGLSSLDYGETESEDREDREAELYRKRTSGIDPTNKTGMVTVVVGGKKKQVPADERFKYEGVKRVKRKPKKKKKRKSKVSSWLSKLFKSKNA
jgi:hypothetical protein